MRNPKLIVSLLSVALTLLPDIGQTATSVSGIVAGQTWTSAGSPYRLTSDVFITGLTIESNVVVQAAGNYEFEVAGLLRVRGTSNAPVLFTAEDTTNGWKGIVFRDAVPGSFFNHAIFERANASALRITNTPPALTNCIIRDNTSPWWGGGILANVSEKPLILKGCLITNNYAAPQDTANPIFGGGLCVLGSVLLADSVVVSNHIGGYRSYGGGVFIRGECVARNCRISSNHPDAVASQDGAGIYADNGTLDMSNCEVSGNGVVGAAYQYGGALTVWAVTATARNCLFVNNAHQGAWLETSGSLALLNCTITGNGHQGIVQQRGGQVGITNCIVYLNYPGGDQLYGPVSVAYSDVQGGVQPGPGNISFSPALCPGNYSLIAGSPCIDAGTPDPAFNDLCIDNAELCTPYSRGTVRNDMGAYGGPGGCAWLHGDSPKIETQPRGASSCLGKTVTFSVGISGAEPLSYQWYFNNTQIPGATESQLTLTNLQSTSAGSYYVSVSNPFGSVSSNPAQLVVNDACVDLKMYAGLTIDGQVGKTYVLKYTTDISKPLTDWAPLSTNVMSAGGWFYLDMDSPYSPRRFYNVQLQN